MKVQVDNFKGTIPRADPRSLPDGFADDAVNTRLLSTNLEAWADNLLVTQLEKAAYSVSPINAVHLMARQYWLHWLDSELAAGQVSVDVALGAVPADTTERTYFTGTTNGPQVTNITKATTGTNPNFPLATAAYPNASLWLGVTAPTTAPSVNDEGIVAGYLQSTYDDGTNLSAWTITAGAVSSDVVNGNPAPSYRLSWIFSAPSTYMYQPFDVCALSQYAVRYEANRMVSFAGNANICLLGATDLGDGIFVSVSASQIKIGHMTDWNGGGRVVVKTGPTGIISSSGGDFYRITILVTKGETNTDIDVSIGHTTGLDFGSLSATVPKLATGQNIGFINDGSSFTSFFNVDNIRTYTAEDSSIQSARNYVYVYRNEYFELGPPSPVSNIVTISDGFGVLITGINDPSTTNIANRGINKKLLYRAVTTETGTQFQFVDTVDLGVTTYTDTKLDVDLGETLESDNYDLPPIDGHSILSAPNGITFMASKNQVFPSVQNRPHAYPVEYALSTDSTVVTLGAIDSNIVVVTETYPYIISGFDPSRLSMSKLEINQGCVSKRSLATIGGFGVLYASPDGLVAVQAVGAVQVLTEQIISRDEWQALVPESIIGSVHDNRYFGFYDDGTTQGGFVFDPKQDGNGFTWVDFYAQAEFSDALSDGLHLVINDVLYRWNAAPTRRPYRWRSKLYQLPMPANLRQCQIRAVDYSSITLKLFDEGVEYASMAVTSGMEFTLPPKRDGSGRESPVTEFQFELSGTSKVQTAQIAEDMEELT